MWTTIMSVGVGLIENRRGWEGEREGERERGREREAGQEEPRRGSRM